MIIQKILSTKLPTKDETSETTELNLINTFSYIYDFLHFKASFFSLQNHLVNNKNTNSEEKIKEPVASKTFCNISFNINSSRFYFLNVDQDMQSDCLSGVLEPLKSDLRRLRFFISGLV